MKSRDEKTYEDRKSSDVRIHRTTSPDGTEIAGRVVGQGPPLVLLHGSLYCGETAWEALLPHLTGRFTCLLPSVRGRGLSAHSEDVTRERMFEDMVAFIDSIGQAVPVFGWSGGASAALGAAEVSDAVSAVAAYEPGVLEVIDEETLSDIGDMVARARVKVERGRAAEAALLFSAFACNDEELAAVVAQGRNEITAPNVATDLRYYENVDLTRPTPTSPDALATIDVPVLVLQGEKTALATWMDRGTSHVAEHVRDAEVRTVPGAGHSAPNFAPEALAAEIVRFLDTLR